MNFGENRKLQGASDEVASSLRAAIQKGELAPGQQLLQEEIAQRFGVSRIPVREAMRQLESEGLITIVLNRSATVTKLSASEILELYEIRSLLECHALRLAMPGFTSIDLERLTLQLKQLDLETNPSKWGELDWQFHQQLYALANRSKLAEMIDRMRNSTNRFYFLGGGQGAHLPDCQASHWKLLDAVKSGDAAIATQVLHQHLMDAAEKVAQDAG
jgi:DNA-binding GntR family transcriptional regulator